MHDDPTRMMDQPDPGGQRPRGNMRLLVAGLIAVILGLVLAIIVIAGDGDGGDTVSIPEQATTLPTTSDPTTETTETESTETTQSTEPTTEEETATAPETETPTTPAPEDGSGGIEAP